MAKEHEGKMANRDDLKKRLSILRRQAEASLGERLPAPEGVTVLSRAEMEKLVHDRLLSWPAGTRLLRETNGERYRAWHESNDSGANV